MEEEIIENLHTKKINRLPFNNEKLYFVKMPQWMQFNEKEFDAKKFESGEYNEEIEGIEDDDGKRLILEQTLRWRKKQDKDGNESIESNANFIRWSDGSLSLKFGNELYDVSTFKESSNQHILANLEGDKILKTQATPSKRMMFRPYTLKQDIHRRLTKAIRAKNVDTVKTKEIFSENDPLSQQAALEKSEMEKIRARRRLEAKRRNITYDRSKKMTRADLEASDTEDSEDQDSEEQDMDRYDADDDGFIVGSDEEVVDGSATDTSDDLDDFSNKKKSRRR